MDSIKLFVPLIPGNSGRDSLPLSYIVPHKNLYVLENHNSKIFAVCRLGQQHKCGHSYTAIFITYTGKEDFFIPVLWSSGNGKGKGRPGKVTERSKTLSFLGQLVVFCAEFLRYFVVYGMLFHMDMLNMVNCIEYMVCLWWILLNMVCGCVELCRMWCSIVLMVVSWLVRTPERPWRQYICINVAIVAVYLANVASVANLTF